MFTKSLNLIVAAAFTATVAGTSVVSAAPIEPDFGTYMMTDAFPTHGLWFSDELVDTNNNGLSGAAQRWAVDSASFL